jgi:hypothetical protein
MTEKEKKLMAYHKAEVEAERLLKDAGIFFKVPSIWAVLVEYFEKYDIPTDVLNEELDGERIFEIISEYYDRNGLPVTAVEVLVQDYAEEIREGKIEKANIKVDGTVWVIHKSDKDPFPSNPHAHDYSNNAKLHLGTGVIYRGKDPYKKMSKRELTMLRSEIISRFPEMSLPDWTR